MSNNKSGKYFPKAISKKQATDTGMAIVLILLLMGFFTQNNFPIKISIPVLVINMTFPKFYCPFAVVWLGFSYILGTIVSKIILTVIYIVFIIPIGILRRLSGKDSLKLFKFKKSNNSVMIERNYVFSAKDVEKPY